MKVIIMLSLLQRFFWPSLVVLEHCLTFLTPEVPGDPGWIFRPISFVAIHPYMLLTEFDKNPIKHVEEEADCEKKERKN